MKKTSANDQPNNPAEKNSSDGLVSGEATMKATIGAHGEEAASMPTSTAVVPQEQNGVSVAKATAPVVATRLRRLISRETLSVPT